jgi:class 3 adenylate cyclase
MPIDLPVNEEIEVYAMIVDMNGFALMVERAGSDLVAQYTRDVLTGGIQAVEDNGGEVVGFMGDAFYVVLDDGKSVMQCCMDIATDIDKMCEYLAGTPDYSFSRPGPSVKITVEYGWLQVSTISSNKLGSNHC